MILRKTMTRGCGFKHLGALTLFVASTASSSQAPTTVPEALQRHNIAPTQAALEAALGDPNAEVRGLAAAQLSAMKATTAIPLILQVFRKERDPQARLNLASAAMWLGSSEGREGLESICKDSSQASSLRVIVAKFTFGENDHACLPAVMAMMRDGSDVGGQILAIAGATQFKMPTPEEAQEILDFTLDALSSTEVRVRLQAAESIRWLHNPTAIPRLREALAREHEEVVRTQFASTLAELLKTDPS